jgi:hypothetical protein
MPRGRKHLLLGILVKGMCKICLKVWCWLLGSNCDNYELSLHLYTSISHFNLNSWLSRTWSLKSAKDSTDSLG